LWKFGRIRSERVGSNSGSSRLNNALTAVAKTKIVNRDDVIANPQLLPHARPIEESRPGRRNVRFTPNIGHPVALSPDPGREAAA
jgi:hypothetical protein